MRAIFSADAPAAIGPYSQAIEAGAFVFCSGQVGIDPARGKLVDGDAAAQMEQALKNLGAVLKAASLDYADVAKTSIFLTNMADFAAINAVYIKYFAQSKPARSTLAAAGLPLGALVEIDAIAIRST